MMPIYYLFGCLWCLFMIFLGTFRSCRPEPSCSFSLLGWSSGSPWSRLCWHCCTSYHSPWDHSCWTSCFWDCCSPRSCRIQNCPGWNPTSPCWTPVCCCWQVPWTAACLHLCCWRAKKQPEHCSNCSPCHPTPSCSSHPSSTPQLWTSPSWYCYSGKSIEIVVSPRRWML